MTISQLSLLSFWLFCSVEALETDDDYCSATDEEDDVSDDADTEWTPPTEKKVPQFAAKRSSKNFVTKPVLAKFGKGASKDHPKAPKPKKNPTKVATADDASVKTECNVKNDADGQCKFLLLLFICHLLITKCTTIVYR